MPAITLSTRYSNWGLLLDPLIQTEIVSFGRASPRLKICSRGTSVGDHSGLDLNSANSLSPAFLY